VLHIAKQGLQPQDIIVRADPPLQVALKVVQAEQRPVK
jgi:hypothetical protein